MVKRIAALIVAVIVAGALSLTAVSPAQAWTKNDNVYFKVIRSEASDLKYVSKTTLRKSAKAVCQYLRSGGTLSEAIDAAEGTGVEYDTALVLVAGAVVFYCPEQEKNY